MMATVLLSAAGAALGSGFGGSILGLSGSVIGRTLGATAGRAIDQRLLGTGADTTQVGKIDRFRISGVGYGTPILEVWGRARIAGQIIWASRFMESFRRTGSGKGAPSGETDTFSYSVSLAIALCRGEVTSVGRIWADGIEIALNSINLRFYPGSEDQLPDSKIEAVEGAGLAPSYRGVCYVVIESLSLSPFGNRVPQFSFEVLRAAQGRQEDLDLNMQHTINAVALIPGTGEYSLATTPARFELSPGNSKFANINTVQRISDFQVSLDQLSAELPNCGSVSLVVSWFGSDLRCSNCLVQPKVEQSERDAVGMPWLVSGVGRADAAVVPQLDGRPVYGGTPTDQSVVEAIRAIRASGKEVMFYPFILLDQLAGNGLPDPWSSRVDQPHLPWRGRITLDRAPGLDGSVDGTLEALTAVGLFLGNAQPSDFFIAENSIDFARHGEWGYRRFILHYALLCKMAGGVDSFCIGSELRGLTQIRSDHETFPMVQALRILAAEVKQILGPNVKISYAADWSEYFGYHIDQDVFFHLDPLWADENIDFVGIDNYMPISDWRDGDSHADASWRSIYNIDYLTSNICGGEGYDWYYDSEESSDEQRRVAIRDIAYGEDWVYRYKDIAGWWSNRHYNRLDSIRQTVPTAWQAGMKPIRFTEYGCAAINRATNEPNKFLDSKSSESSLPRYSNGERDDLIQMQYLSAMARFWKAEENNPEATAYVGRMVDWGRCHAWAWDARPFPDFPGNQIEWSDSVNYARGHWLNGRTGNQQLGAVVAEVCGFVLADQDFDVGGLNQVVRGYQRYSLESVRSSIESVNLIYSFSIRETDGRVEFSELNEVDKKRISVDGLASNSDLVSGYSVTRASEPRAPDEIALSYIGSDGDYGIETVSTSFSDGGFAGSNTSEGNFLLLQTEAQSIVDRLLAIAKVSQRVCRLSLPLSYLGICVGDVLTFLDLDFLVNGVEVSDFVNIEATLFDFRAFDGLQHSGSAILRAPSLPPPYLLVVFMDLPLLLGTEDPQSPYVAVSSSSWPGRVAVWSSSTDVSYLVNEFLESPAIVGSTLDELSFSGSGLWDRGSVLRVRTTSSMLFSVSSEDVLNGANFAAIGDGSVDGWELFQFERAALVDGDTYVISGLLRGLCGSDALMPHVWPLGSFFVLVDSAVVQLKLPLSVRGLERHYRIGAAERGYSDQFVITRDASFDGVGLRPYSVCHLSWASFGDGSIGLSWIRRTRIDGDNWDSLEVPLGEEDERYRVRVLLDSALIREEFVSSPFWSYSESSRLADIVGLKFTVEVSQISLRFGSGPGVSLEVSI